MGHTALIADTLPAAQLGLTAAGLAMAGAAAILVARRTRAILIADELRPRVESGINSN
jgi:hypothetical protein